MADGQRGLALERCACVARAMLASSMLCAGLQSSRYHCDTWLLPRSFVMHGPSISCVCTLECALRKDRLCSCSPLLWLQVAVVAARVAAEESGAAGAQAAPQSLVAVRERADPDTPWWVTRSSWHTSGSSGCSSATTICAPCHLEPL
jgi:hypothetical protein